MNPALTFGYWNTLDSVYPGFELQIFICFVAADSESNFTEAPAFVRCFVDQFDLIAVVFGPSDVHAEKLACKQAGFVAAGCSPDFYYYIAVIVRILRR